MQKSSRFPHWKVKCIIILQNCNGREMYNNLYCKLLAVDNARTDLILHCLKALQLAAAKKALRQAYSSDQQRVKSPVNADHWKSPAARHYSRQEKWKNPIGKNHLTRSCRLALVENVYIPQHNHCSLFTRLLRYLHPYRHHGNAWALIHHISAEIYSKVSFKFMWKKLRIPQNLSSLKIK